MIDMVTKRLFHHGKPNLDHTISYEVARLLA